MANTANQSYTIINPSQHGHFFFTAEHACHALPVSPATEEEHWLHTHWGYDIGILPLMTQLCSVLSSQGIHSNYSRLWIDTNRAPTQEGLIKESIEGHPLSFNQNLSPSQRQERIDSIHESYHQAIHKALVQHPRPVLLISLHSFTPIWENHIRTMDVGVLFDRDEDIAYSCATIIKDAGFFVEMNQPYSGKNGLIYSADRHGSEQNIPYIEFEFNQSILSSPERIHYVAHKMQHILTLLHTQHSDLFTSF